MGAQSPRLTLLCFSSAPHQVPSGAQCKPERGLSYAAVGLGVATLGCENDGKGASNFFIYNLSSVYFQRKPLGRRKCAYEASCCP